MGHGSYANDGSRFYLACKCHSLVCHRFLHAVRHHTVVLTLTAACLEVCDIYTCTSYRCQLAGFHLGFFVWGGEDCVQRSITCEACKVFEPIFEYQSPMHEKNIKPEFLLLAKLLGFWGGSWRVWGGSFPPAPPSR